MSWYDLAKSKMIYAQREAKGSSIQEWMRSYWPLFRDAFGLSYMDEGLERAEDGTVIPPGVDQLGEWDGSMDNARLVDFLDVDFRLVQSGKIGREVKPEALGSKKPNAKTKKAPGHVGWTPQGEAIKIGPRQTLEYAREEIWVQEPSEKALGRAKVETGRKHSQSGDFKIVLNRGCGRAAWCVMNHERGVEGMMLKGADGTLLPVACYSCSDGSKTDTRACYAMNISRSQGWNTMGENSKFITQDDLDIIRSVKGDIEKLNKKQLTVLRGNMDDKIWHDKYMEILRIAAMIMSSEVTGDPTREREAEQIVETSNYGGLLPSIVAVRLTGGHRGKDERSGISTDGSAWLHPYSMLAVARAGLNTWSCISSCYYPPPISVEEAITNLRSMMPTDVTPEEFEELKRNGDPRGYMDPFTPEDEEALSRLRDRTAITVTLSGWHHPREIEHRIAWIREAKAAGWNVIARWVTDSDHFETRGLTLDENLRGVLGDEAFMALSEAIQPSNYDEAGKKEKNREQGGGGVVMTEEQAYEDKVSQVAFVFDSLIAQGRTDVAEIRDNLRSYVSWEDASDAPDSVGWRDRFPNQMLVMKLAMDDLLNADIPVMENPYHFGHNYSKKIFDGVFPACCDNFEAPKWSRKCGNCRIACGHGFSVLWGGATAAEMQLDRVDTAIGSAQSMNQRGDIDDGLPGGINCCQAVDEMNVPNFSARSQAMVVTNDTERVLMAGPLAFFDQVTSYDAQKNREPQPEDIIGTEEDVQPEEMIPEEIPEITDEMGDFIPEEQEIQEPQAPATWQHQWNYPHFYPQTEDDMAVPSEQLIQEVVTDEPEELQTVNMSSGAPGDMEDKMSVAAMARRITQVGRQVRSEILAGVSYVQPQQVPQRVSQIVDRLRKRGRIVEADRILSHFQHDRR